MLIPGTHDLIHQISLIRQKEQPLGFFVQSAYRINAKRIIQIICYCGFISLLFRAADDSSWFIKKKKYFSVVFTDRHLIQADFFIRGYFLSAYCFLSVHGNPSLFDQSVRFPAGTYTCVA